MPRNFHGAVWRKLQGRGSWCARREDANDVDDDKLELVNTSRGAVHRRYACSVCALYVEVAATQPPLISTHRRGIVREAASVKRCRLKKAGTKEIVITRGNAMGDVVIAFSCATPLAHNKLKIIL